MGATIEIFKSVKCMKYMKQANGVQTEDSYFTFMKGFLRETQKDLSCFFNVVVLYQLEKILLLVTGLMLIMHFSLL